MKTNKHPNTNNNKTHGIRWLNRWNQWLPKYFRKKKSLEPSQDNIVNLDKIMLQGWEPEGHYLYSKMFRCEPEGCYRHRQCTVIVPFWLSTKHLRILIMPFWLSTDALFFRIQNLRKATSCPLWHSNFPAKTPSDSLLKSNRKFCKVHVCQKSLPSKFCACSRCSTS